jgi:dCTP deaminase
VTPVVVSQIRWGGKEADIERDLRVLRVLDFQLKVFAADLRYVESARTDRLPWQIIPSFEKLVSDLRPGAQVMLRPMWHYNYATIVSNLRDFYLESLQEFENYLPLIDVESKILAPLGPTFHIISFPALEKDNILLHSLIGHEIGHLIANDLVRQDETEYLDGIRNEIESFADSTLKDQDIDEGSAGGPLALASMRAKLIGEISDLCLIYWSRALKEILSDVVGTILFGPAALFSTLEIAVQSGFDLAPTRSNNYYPPWRTRIREILNVVDALAGDLLSVESAMFKIPVPFSLKGVGGALGLTSEKRADFVNERVQTIRALAAESSDRIQIDKYRPSKIAYDALPEYIKKHTESIISIIGKNAFKKSSLKRLLPALIERLDAGITPNAEHDMPSKAGASVGLVEVLNSAWYQKVSLSSPQSSSYVEQFETLRSQRNRLTLKSIDFTFLSSQYPKTKRLPAVAGESTKAGALSGSQLQGLMEKLDIRERLIVTPLFNPAESIGSSAIDVRLGTEFILFKKETFQSLDVTSASSIGEGIRYRNRIIRKIREPFILHPRQLVIGSTMEYIQVPEGLMAYVIGKSTWGRTGLIIATATKVDPGFKGCITLEIVNEGEVPLVLVPGLPIAQLVFHPTSNSSSYEGVYGCPIGPEFPNFERIIQNSSFWLSKNPKK